MTLLDKRGSSKHVANYIANHPNCVKPQYATAKRGLKKFFNKIKGGENCVFKVNISNEEKEITPELIVEKILHKIKDLGDTRAAISVEKVVVSIPANYSRKQ